MAQLNTMTALESSTSASVLPLFADFTLWSRSVAMSPATRGSLADLFACNAL